MMEELKNIYWIRCTTIKHKLNIEVRASISQPKFLLFCLPNILNMIPPIIKFRTSLIVYSLEGKRVKLSIKRNNLFLDATASLESMRVRE